MGIAEQRHTPEGRSGVSGASNCVISRGFGVRGTCPNSWLPTRRREARARSKSEERFIGEAGVRPLAAGFYGPLTEDDERGG